MSRFLASRCGRSRMRCALGGSPTMPEPSTEFHGLRALFINCTLKRSPEVSNTQGLIDISTRIMEASGVVANVVRAVDHDIATGVWPDMREHGWATDDWPAIFEKVLAADILVLAGPIWLGDNSSVMKQVHERTGWRLPYHRKRRRSQALRPNVLCTFTSTPVPAGPRTI